MLVNNLFSGEVVGNVIDLCPVGALTSKPYAFTGRAWELVSTESIDILDSLCSNIRIDSRGSEVMRILPRLNYLINNEWITDKIRFCHNSLKQQRILSPMRISSLRMLGWDIFNETYDNNTQEINLYICS